MMICSLGAAVFLFGVAQLTFGSERRDAASGWLVAPLIPFAWPLAWLPVFWVSYGIAAIVLERTAWAKSSYRQPALGFSILVYCLVAILHRHYSGEGAFIFYR